MSRHRTGTRDRRPVSGSHKIPSKISTEDFHDELQASLDEFKVSIIETLKDHLDQRFDQLEKKLDHVEQQLSTVKSDVNRINEKSADFSTVSQSQRDIERNITQMMESIRSFQLIMVLSGAKNANESLKHDILTSLGSVSKDTTTPNLLGS